jgi:hypothetical protein
MSRFGRTEKMIFSAALLLLLMFSYFLYDDSLLFPNGNRSEQELVGRVYQTQNDVRRKNNNTFSWLPASQKDTVFENDSIYTGDRSEASVQLNDGTILHVAPNSLITVSMKDGQMNLDLRYGNLTGEISKGANIVVKSDGEEFQLSGTEPHAKIKIAKSHLGNVDMKLLAGAASFKNKKTQAAPQKLHTDTAMALSKKGDLKPIEKISVVLKTPNGISWLRANPEDPLPFEWKGQGPIAKYQIEISGDPSFEKNRIEKVTADSALKITEALEPGSYFWRVKAFNSQSEVSAISATQKVSIVHLSGPELLNPQSSETFSLEVPVTRTQKEIQASTPVRWQAPKELKSFTWQIASDEQFKSVIKEGHTTESETPSPRLDSGTYWVRVQGATDKGVLSPWSEAHSFTFILAAKRPETPKKPVLITKSVNYKIPKAGTRVPASEAAPKFAWQPVMHSKSYQVEVSKDLSFVTVDKFEAANTETLWSHFQQGKSYFRVFARASDGILSEPSDIGQVEVSQTIDYLATPKLIEPFNQASIFLQNTAHPLIWLEWSGVSGAKYYEIEISRSPDFSTKILTNKVQANRMLIDSKIPNGKLYWRVRATTDDATTLSQWTSQQEFTVYHHKNEIFVQ